MKKTTSPKIAETRRGAKANPTPEALEQAFLRVKSKGQELTITAVALEAGRTPSLIHNTYPKLAERIRAEMGRSTREQRDAIAAELEAVKETLTQVRAELKGAKADNAKLASVNETLRDELALSRAKVSGSVVEVRDPRRISKR